MCIIVGSTSVCNYFVAWFQIVFSFLFVVIGSQGLQFKDSGECYIVIDI